MTAEESTYPGDWLRVAEKDLGRIERHLEAQDPEAAAFIPQQAVEKLLKALLLANGQPIERIHDLESLLNKTLPQHPEFAPFRPVCQRISAFHLLERYPFLDEVSVTEADVRECMRQIDDLIGTIRRAIRDRLD